MTDFRPVFEVGKFNSPRSKSTNRHSRSKISRRRQPVKSKSRIAAVANGDTTVIRRSGFAKCLAFGPHSLTVHGTPTVLASRSAQPLELLRRQEPLACGFAELLDAARRVDCVSGQEAARDAEREQGRDARQRAVGGHGMALVDLDV